MAHERGAIEFYGLTTGDLNGAFGIAAEKPAGEAANRHGFD